MITTTPTTLLEQEAMRLSLGVLQVDVLKLDYDEHDWSYTSSWPIYGSQARSRELCYRWEETLSGLYDASKLNRKQIVTLMEKVCRDYDVLAPRLRIDSKLKRGGHYVSDFYKPLITINTEHMNAKVVLHELAHHIDARLFDGQCHEQTFVATVIELYHDYLGIPHNLLTGSALAFGLLGFKPLVSHQLDGSSPYFIKGLVYNYYYKEICDLKHYHESLPAHPYHMPINALLDAIDTTRFPNTISKAENVAAGLERSKSTYNRHLRDENVDWINSAAFHTFAMTWLHKVVSTSESRPGYQAV